MDMIYIDGKNINDGIKETDSRGKLEAQSKKLFDAIRKGKIIEGLSIYQDSERTEYQVTPLHFNITKQLTNQEFVNDLKDQYCKDHHIGWWHRNVFNWGWFKIKYPDWEKEFNKEILLDTQEACKIRHEGIIEQGIKIAGLEKEPLDLKELNQEYVLNPEKNQIIEPSQVIEEKKL